VEEKRLWRLKQGKGKAEEIKRLQPSPLKEAPWGSPTDGT
jgi:hypothetical protein